MTHNDVRSALNEQIKHELQSAYFYLSAVGYFESVLEHYQFAGEHLKTTKGYEYYGKFSEKIATYRTKIVDGVVLVHVKPLKPGTQVPPSLIEA